MPADPAPEAQERLRSEQNLWLASVRPDGRPHLVPVWFVWVEGRVYVCTDPSSVKANNIASERRVAVALQDGTRPVIAEATARELPSPWPDSVVRAFQAKYDWDITTEDTYRLLLEITPGRWLVW